MLNNRCRTCLRYKRQMKLLSSKWTNNVSFANMLMDIISITTEPTSDNVKNLWKICATCEQDLITSYNFKIVCQNTEKILYDNKISSPPITPPLPSPSASSSSSSSSSNTPSLIEEIKIENLKDEQIQIMPEISIIEEENAVNFIKEENESTDFNKDSCLNMLNLKKSTKRIKKPMMTEKKKNPPKKCNPMKRSRKKLKEKPNDDDDENDDTNINTNDDQIVTKTNEKKKRKRSESKYCKRCDIRHESVNEYMKHLRTVHWEQSICPVCGKQFYSGKMKAHMVSHSTERNHICSVCGAKFLYDNNLKEHMRIHSGEKRYKCSYCDESFVHWNSRKNHIYLKHTHEKK